MRKVVVGIAAVAVVIAVLIWVGHDDTKPTTHEPRASTSERSTHGARTPALPQSAGSGSQGSVFIERKQAALVEMRRTLQQQILECPAPPEAAPHDVLLTFKLVLDQRLSEPELQRYVVQSVELGPTTSPITPEAKGCISRLQGATMNVLVKRDDVPADAQAIQESIALPLR